jgi:hypothetical protein
MLHIDVKTLMLLLHESEGALQQSHYLLNKEIDKAYCQYYVHVAYEDLTQNINYYTLRSLTTTKHRKLGNFHDVPFQFHQQQLENLTNIAQLCLSLGLIWSPKKDPIFSAVSLFILVTFLERINLEISTLGTQTPH